MIIVDHNPCRADVTHVYFYRKIDFSKTCFLTSISTKIDVTNIFTLCFYRNFHGSHTPHIDPSSTPFFFIPVCSLLPSFQKSAGSKQMITQTLFIFYFYIDILWKFPTLTMSPIPFKTGLPHPFFSRTFPLPKSPRSEVGECRSILQKVKLFDIVRYWINRININLTVLFPDETPDRTNL